MSTFFVSRFARTKRSGRGASHRGAAVAVQRLAHLSPWWIGVVACGALLVAYVWQTTLLATTGFEVGSLDHARAALEERVAALRVESLDQQSLVRVEARVRESNFIPDGAVQYVTAAELTRTVSQR